MFIHINNFIYNTDLITKVRLSTEFNKVVMNFVDHQHTLDFKTPEGAKRGYETILKLLNSREITLDE
jgi:hypothetical protein